MEKLYRMMLICIAIASFAIQANAQWSNDYSQNLLISSPGQEGQDLVQTGKTSDNKVFIAWISWEDASAYIKLQLLDKDGNALLGEGGMYVCKYPTPTWSSGFGFTVSPDNCALIVNSDTRNGTETGWKPYVYKINQKGEHVWSPEGVCLLSQEGLSGVDPRICITSDDNLVIGFRQLSKASGGGSKLMITKLLADGSKAWGENVKVADLNVIYNIIPSLNGSFFVAYYESFSTQSGNYALKKYTSNGEEVWDELKYIDNSGMVKVQAEPTWVIDGSGGFVVGYRYSDGNRNYGAVQSFNSNGDYILEDYTLADLPTVCIDPDHQFIYAACITGGYGQSSMSLTQYSWAGEEIKTYDDLTEGSSFQYILYGITAIDQKIYVIYRNSPTVDEMKIEYSIVGTNGEVAAKHLPISISNTNKDRGSLTVTDDQLVLSWMKRSSQNGGEIYAQNIKRDKVEGIQSTDIITDARMKIYQNTREEFTVEIHSSKASNAIVNLMDCSGKCIYTTPIHLNAGQNSFNCPVGNLLSGFYLLTVDSNLGRLSGKLSIQ